MVLIPVVINTPKSSPTRKRGRNGSGSSTDDCNGSPPELMSSHISRERHEELMKEQEVTLKNELQCKEEKCDELRTNLLKEKWIQNNLWRDLTKELKKNQDSVQKIRVLENKNEILEKETKDLRETLAIYKHILEEQEKVIDLDKLFEFITRRLEEKMGSAVQTEEREDSAGGSEFV